MSCGFDQAVAADGVSLLKSISSAECDISVSEGAGNSVLDSALTGLKLDGKKSKKEITRINILKKKDKKKKFKEAERLKRLGLVPEKPKVPSSIPLHSTDLSLLTDGDPGKLIGVSSNH